MTGNIGESEQVFFYLKNVSSADWQTQLNRYAEVSRVPYAAGFWGMLWLCMPGYAVQAGAMRFAGKGGRNDKKAVFRENYVLIYYVKYASQKWYRKALMETRQLFTGLKQRYLG